jgi:hypothetical protein
VTDGELLEYQHGEGKFQDVFANDFQFAHHRLTGDYPVGWPSLPPNLLVAIWEQIICIPPAQYMGEGN